MHQIFKEINAYQTIIIHRHKRPDMDAIGSQVGLKELLISMYPNKNIYAVGDLNNMSYLASMDTIEDSVYQGALVIITDVSVKHMISDDRYPLGDARIIIDHHENETDVEDVRIFYRDSSFSSACEMIINLARNEKLDIPQDAATYLYGGMVTDSGRFMYLKEASRTFELAAYVTQFKPNIKDFYEFLYTEPLEKRKIKNKFQQFEVTDNNVAFRINTYEDILDTGLDFQAISRGMVNLMAGIQEIPIWGSFCQDETGNYIAELRSRNIPIVDIAKKYGGGGHLHACGATLNTLEQVYDMLKDLDERKLQHEND